MGRKRDGGRKKTRGMESLEGENVGVEEEVIGVSLFSMGNGSTIARLSFVFSLRQCL